MFSYLDNYPTFFCNSQSFPANIPTDFSHSSAFPGQPLCAVFQRRRKTGRAAVRGPFFSCYTSATVSHTRPMADAPSSADRTGERSFQRRPPRLLPAQFFATRRASSTSCRDVTPRPAASLRTMKIACSKNRGSGESTTTTRLETPLTIRSRTPCLFSSISSFTGRRTFYTSAAIPAALPRRTDAAPARTGRRCRRPGCRIPAGSPRPASGDLPLPSRR